MKGHEVLATALVDQGVDTAFGLVGDANVFMVDAMVREHGVRYVGAAHEASAVMMATGFARSTGRVGVATVTHGPGLTNTVTALVEGVRSRIPLLLVCGDTAAIDRQHLQKIDQRALVLATGAGFEAVRSPTTIATDTANAVRRVRAEGRPVVLNVPLDFEREEVDAGDPVAPVQIPALSLGPDPAALDVAVGIIASAARPVVVAGRGAVQSGAGDALRHLAERLGAPLATTLLARELFRGDPFDLGIFGTLSTAAAAEAISSADCIITFGASLNYFTTDRGSLLSGKRVVQCDIDPSRIGSTVPVDAGVVGDAARIATTMVDWLDQAEHKPSGFRSPQLEQQLRAADPWGGFTDLSTDKYLDPRTFTRRLDRLLPADRTVAVDAGRFMHNALKLPVPEPQALVTTHGFGSIGLGMGAAIGAAVGRSDRPAVLLIGDGGFMLGGLVELNTAVQEELDLIIVVYNDGSYGAEHIQFRNAGMDPGLSLRRWPELAPLAEAMGATGVTVGNLADLDAAASAINSRRGVLLLDVKLDPAMISEITTH